MDISHISKEIIGFTGHFRRGARFGIRTTTHDPGFGEVHKCSSTVLYSSAKRIDIISTQEKLFMD